MRAYEILQEKISLTKYTDDIYDAIKNGIIMAITNLDRDNPTFKSVRDKVDSTGSSSALTSLLEPALVADIKHYVQNILQDTVTKIISPEQGYYIPVSFKDIKAAGQASGMKIELSNRGIDNIAKEIFRRYEQAVSDNIEDEHDIYKVFFNIKDDDYVHRHIIGYIDSEITELADTVIHEMVHILQHDPQFKKGRHHEFRSYLDKRKNEYLDIARKEADSPEYSDRWEYLYYASPQEIAAHAHNMALSIINSWGLTRNPHLNLYNLPDKKDILATVQNEVTKYENPKTKTEQMVRQRYMKRVYQEVERYIEHLTEVLKKKDAEIELPSEVPKL